MANHSLEQFVHPKQAACVEVFFSSRQKSRWCVSPYYDFLIEEAVSQGYTQYEALPRDFQYRLALEIIQVEKGSIFSDADSNLELAECLTQILITRGKQSSFDALHQCLRKIFIYGEVNKPAYLSEVITAALEDQYHTQQWEIGDIDQELYSLEEGYRHG